MLWAPPMLYVEFCPVQFWWLGADRLHCSAKIPEKELDPRNCDLYQPIVSID